MAKVKPAGIDKANTIELLPTLGTFNEMSPATFKREGWVLEYINLRGQGGIKTKKEQYNERTLKMKLNNNRTLELNLKDRQYSLFRSVCVKGSDFIDFRNWIGATLPFFSCSITSFTIRHEETGARLSIRKIGKDSVNQLSKKLIVHTFNGAKMSQRNINAVSELLGRLKYAMCSYDYSSFKSNVICDM